MLCKNCQLALNDDDQYCRSCGGKVIHNRLNLRNLFEHITETFFNYDNKLIRTLIDLIKRPQVVIHDYVSGVRMRYVNPISFFALSLTIAGLSIFIMKKFYMDAMDFSYFFQNSSIYSEEFIANMNESTGNSLEYSSLIYSAMVPVFAIISAIIFYDKTYNFTEHVVLYLYSMSILSIFSVLIAQIVLLINPKFYLLFSFINFPIMFVYHMILLKKLFKLNAWELVLRSMLAIFLIGFLYVAVILIGVVVGFASGSIDPDHYKLKKI